MNNLRLLAGMGFGEEAGVSALWVPSRQGLGEEAGYPSLTNNLRLLAGKGLGRRPETPLDEQPAIATRHGSGAVF